MLRWKVIGVAATAVLFLAAGVATADPVAPQSNTPCTPDLEGAMTWPADATAPLVCAGATWAPVADPYPISDRWVSYGPAMTLHGQGRRNPNLLSGDWTAVPLEPESRCSATQVAVIPGTPTLGAPRVDQTATGQPLVLEVIPVLFTIEMTGDCLWQRSR